MIDALIQYLFFPLFFGTVCLFLSLFIWQFFEQITDINEEYKKNGKIKIFDLKKIIFVYLLGAVVTGFFTTIPFS